MSVNPRSYRVPVLRLTDVYKGDAVNGDPGTNDVLDTSTPPQPPQIQPEAEQEQSRDAGITPQQLPTSTSIRTSTDYIPEEPVVPLAGSKDDYIAEPVPDMSGVTYTPTAPSNETPNAPTSTQPAPSPDPVPKPPTPPPPTPPQFPHAPAPPDSRSEAKTQIVPTPPTTREADAPSPAPQKKIAAPWIINPSPDRPDTLADVPHIEDAPPPPPPPPKPLVAPLKKPDDPFKQVTAPDMPDMWEAATQAVATKAGEAGHSSVQGIASSSSSPAPTSPSAPESAVQAKVNAMLASMGGGSTSTPREQTGSKPAATPAETPGASTSDTQQTANAVPQPPHTPETEHAKVLSAVARRLHTIHDSTGLLPDSEPTSSAGVNHGQYKERDLVITPASDDAPSKAIPMIRTFKADVENAITHNKVSLTKMVADEEKIRYEPKERTEIRHTKKRHINVRVYALILGGVVLLAATIGLGFVVAGLILENRSEKTTSEIFFSDAAREFDITNKDRTALMKGLTDLRDTMELKVNETAEVSIIEQVSVPGTEDTQKVPVSASALLSAIDVQAPDYLSRTLYDSFIFGIFRDDTGKRNPFFIFKVRTFGIAFPGMLEWETGLDADLAPLFGNPVSRELLNRAAADAPGGTNSGSGGVPTPSSLIDTGQIGLYDDVDIANQAVRALRNPDGEIQLLWTILPGNNMLIITTTPETFREVRKRTQS